MAKEMTTGVDEQALQAFKQTIRGAVLHEDDAAYEDARKVWNGIIDRYPALIVRATGAADVMAAVNFAREHALPVSVRGGGHNVAGSAVHDGALVIDLSQMRGVRVEPLRKTVRVEGGALLGDVDHETQAFGLATPLGLQSLTGVAGLSLHGGLGFQTRKHGLSADNLIAADVVTADGQLRFVDSEHHADILWAMRGGGSVGVVTSFEFQLHPLGPEVWVGFVIYPFAQARQILKFFRSHMADAPDELMALAIYWSAPHEEFIPEAYRGAPVMVLGAFWSGPFEVGERAIQPFRQAGTPVADLSGAMPFVAAQTLFDADYPDGRRYYWKSIYLENLDDAVISLLNDYAAQRPSPLSSVDIWALGGAMARKSSDASAFFRRDAPYLLGIESNWDDPHADEANVAWARELYREAQRHTRGGGYLNFPGFLEEGDQTLRQTFGGNYERLREIQTKYDPDELFRFNLRIPRGL